MAKNSRRIGHNWEREVSKDLKGVYCPHVRRGRQDMDPIEEPDVANAYPFWIECKCGRNLRIENGITQAEKDMENCKRGDYLVPILACHDTRTHRKFVVVNYSDFIGIIGFLMETGAIRCNVCGE